MTKEEMYKTIKEYIETNEGYMKYNGITVDEIDDEHVILKAKIENNKLNPSNIAHGGFIFTLADSCMGMLARTVGKNVVTVNSSIDYLKAAKGEYLVAISTPIKVGKTFGFYKCEIKNEENILVSEVKGTYYFID